MPKKTNPPKEIIVTRGTTPAYNLFIDKTALMFAMRHTKMLSQMR